jgi:ABC-type uncharacterized transport system substrate-binding protein
MGVMGYGLDGLRNSSACLGSKACPHKSSSSVPDLFRRAGTYADKILNGAKPANIPVEQSSKFEFIIDLKAAKQFGLTIPPNMLAPADRVIK